MQPVLGKRRNDHSCKLEHYHLNFAAIKEVTLLRKKIAILF